MNRRQFLLKSWPYVAALTGTCGKLSLAAQHVGAGGEDDEFKALVCIFLQGGNDSFNMLIPSDKDRFSEYQSARGSMALNLGNSKNAAIGLQSQNRNEQFAVHPACTELADLYKKQRLAFVANVGTLVEPTSIKSVLEGSARLPSSLFSHNDQRNQWHSAQAKANASTGWLGRAADVFHDTGSDTSFSMNVSLSGSNLMQTGQWVLPYSISADGPVEVNSSIVLDALNSTRQSQSSDNIFEQVFADTQFNARQRNQYFAKLFNNHRVDTLFPDTVLGNSLKAIATKANLFCDTPGMGYTSRTVRQTRLFTC